MNATRPLVRRARTRRSRARTSRRGFLARLATLLVGGAALPLLPVARAHGATRAPAPGEPDPGTPAGDPGDCDYWRHCAIDGFLCSCCGGTQRACPPGTEMSPVTWIGTCRNPGRRQGLRHLVQRLLRQGHLRAVLLPPQRGRQADLLPDKANDINWCMGRAGVVYNSTAIVLGVATEKG